MPNSPFNSALGALNPELDVGDVNASVRPARSGNFLDIAVHVGNNFHLVPKTAVGTGHHRKGNEAGTVNRDRVTPRVVPRNMQAAGAHRFKLCRVRLDREKLDLLAGCLGEVVEKLRPDTPVHLRILDWGIREDQRIRINPLRGVGRRVRDKVPIFVHKSKPQVAVLLRLRRRFFSALLSSSGKCHHPCNYHEAYH